MSAILGIGDEFDCSGSLAAGDTKCCSARSSPLGTEGLGAASALTRSGDLQRSATVRFCRHGTDGMRDPELVG